MMEQAKIQSFRTSLREFERALNRDLEEHNCCCELTLAQCHPLLEIDLRGQTTLVELAQSLELDKSTLSRTVDALVNKGLVSRTPHPDDRRYTRLTLTDAGKRICADINSRSDAHYRKVFQRIPESEHDEVMKGFTLLARAMTATDSEPGGAEE